MKPSALLDTSVVVAGIGWKGGDARTVFGLLAMRGFISYRTPAVTEEWSQILARMADQPRWENPNWPGWLDWLKRASRLHPDLAAKAMSRDRKDDPIINGAIACHAGFLVTYDQDLLALEKPYGVACVTPRAFLSHVLRSS